MPISPNIIISTNIGGQRRYVLKAPFGPTNKRMPSFTPDMEKAQRFTYEYEAVNFYTRFPKDGRVYEAEPLQQPQHA